MTKYDIAEIPKQASVSSLISAMINYEFIGYAMISLILSKLSNRCPFMNGAAFAIRQSLFNKLEGFRGVVNEDNDISSRAFRLDARFGFSPSLSVKNDVPASIGEWLKQRRRWALNNIYWLQDHFLHVFFKMFKSPRLFLSFLFLIMPLIAFFLVFFLAANLHLTAILPFIFLHFQHYNILGGVFLWISHYRLITTEGIIPTVIGLLISELITFVFSRILRFRFNFLDYVLFYFVYSPIWVIINLIIWVLVLLNIEVDLDWKI
jgi:cellulose synthase/poly-beta-1,6-N-acetylglucosamine synthase-like glycosyltransferase